MNEFKITVDVKFNTEDIEKELRDIINKILNEVEHDTIQKSNKVDELEKAVNKMIKEKETFKTLLKG